MKNGDTLTRDDVIGRKIVAIHQVFRWDVEGIDQSCCYFLLDSGLSFYLPGECADRLWFEHIPPDADRFDDSDIADVLDQPIEAVLRERPRNFISYESLFLLLKNRWMLAQCMAGFHGTGFAGLKQLSPADYDLNDFEPFWS